MKLSKRIVLLIFSTFLVAQEAPPPLEMVPPIPPNNTYDENFSVFVIPSPTIDENVLALEMEENSSTPSIFLNFDEALKIAKEDHKMVLLEVVSTNCKFCNQMREEVLAQEEVRKKIEENFVLAQVNMDQEPLPLGLSEQMTPMFVFISEDENVEDMRFGYMNEHDFIGLLEIESR